MEIQIHNFMKHPNLKLNFKLSKVTLLTGDSESGKSSILYAFLWCLYGKVSKVYRGESGKVWVRLKWNHLTIYRQARPGKLNLINTKTKGNYSGSAAQSTINQIFGSKSVWICSSLLQQKKTSHIMETTYDERMEILQELTFDQDSPDEYLDQIEKYIGKQKQKYDKLITQYDIYYQNHLEIYRDTDTPINTNIKSLEQDLKDKLTYLSLHESKIKESEQKLQQNRENTLKLKFLQNDLKRDRFKLSQLQKPQPVNKMALTELKNNLHTADNHKKQLIHHKKLKTKINQLNSVLNEYELKEVTEDLYLELKLLQHNYTKNKALADKIKIKYDSEVIKNKIQKYERQIEAYNVAKPKLDLLSRIKNLECKQPNIPPPKVTVDEVKIEKNKYNQMEKNSKLLLCPQCQEPVKYERDRLIKAPPEAEVITNEQLLEQRKLTEEIYAKYKEWVKYKKDQIELDQLKVKVGDVNQIQKYENFKVSLVISKMAQVSKIEYYDSPKYPAEIIKAQIKLNQLKKEMKKLEVNLEFEDITDDLKNKIKEQEELLEQNKDYQYTYIRLTEQIKDLDTQIQTIVVDDMIESKYQTLVETRDRLESQVSDLKLEIAKTKSWILIETHKAKMNKINQKLTTSYKIKEKAINLNCKLLEDTVNDLNLISSSILKNIFDKSVVLEMKLFKKLKVGKRSKQMVNLNIFFDASKHEKRLCGGEEDRISLALLLAINQLSNSPLILIDEKMGTVSARIAKKCFKAIKDYVGSDKIAICVEHNVVKGIYDEVIDLNELGNLE